MLLAVVDAILIAYPIIGIILFVMRWKAPRPVEHEGVVTRMLEMYLWPIVLWNMWRESKDD